MVLEDCNELGLIERWCAVTKEAFLICSAKQLAPSYTIPLAMMSEVRPALSTSADRLTASRRDRDSDLKKMKLMNSQILKADLLAKEKENGLSSPHSPVGTGRPNMFSEMEMASAQGEQGVLDLDEGSFIIRTKGSSFSKPATHVFLTPNSDVRDWWLEGIR